MGKPQWGRRCDSSGIKRWSRSFAAWPECEMSDDVSRNDCRAGEFPEKEPHP